MSVLSSSGGTGWEGEGRSSPARSPVGLQDGWVGGLLLGHRNHPGAGWWRRDSLISTQKAQRCTVPGKKTVIPAISMTFSGENSSQIVCVTLQRCVCICVHTNVCACACVNKRAQSPLVRSFLYTVSVFYLTKGYQR